MKQFFKVFKSGEVSSERRQLVAAQITEIAMKKLKIKMKD